jgi:hypothetical protein
MSGTITGSLMVVPRPLGGTFFQLFDKPAKKGYVGPVELSESDFKVLELS